jgi:hypothetical protein
MSPTGSTALCRCNCVTLEIARELRFNQENRSNVADLFSCGFCDMDISVPFLLLGKPYRASLRLPPFLSLLLNLGNLNPTLVSSLLTTGDCPAEHRGVPWSSVLSAALLDHSQMNV